MKRLPQAALGLLLLIAAPAFAQEPAIVGTLLVAHGASAEWNAQVEQLAAQAQLTGPLEICYIMGPDAASHLFQDAVARLVAKGVSKIVVVPLLVSSHSEHYEQVRWLAGETDSLSATMQEHTHHAGHARAQVRRADRRWRGHWTTHPRWRWSWRTERRHSPVVMCRSGPSSWSAMVPTALKTTRRG